MLPTQVALVPFEANTTVPHDQLLHVAAALQTQLVRDFSPVWGVSAVVSPFLRLEDVPPEYFPLAVVAAGLPLGHHGFHLAIDGRPFGLIHYDPGWSAAASHELMEMVCDPSGERTMPGPSLKDEQDRREGRGRGQKPQGMVDYLVEVCDPCEQSTYEINGVVVSDFVTPHYYDTFTVECQCYSFLGRVTEPRQLLAGGYISWRTRQPQSSIWQAFADETKPSSSYADQSEPDGRAAGAPGKPVALDIEQLAPYRLRYRSRFSREWVDLQRGSRPPVRSARPPVGGQSWGPYGRAFRTDVRKLLDLLNKPVPPPSIHDIIGLLEAVGAGNAPSKEQLEEFNIPSGSVNKLPAQAIFTDILAALKKQQKVSGLFGPDLFDSGLASWLCRLTL